MAIVDLLEKEAYADEVAALDKRVRQYTQAPEMTPYVKAAAHYPPLLAQMGTEHLTVMLTDELRRELKETLAVAVSMTNNCSYCIGAHVTVLKEMFHASDPELVGLAGVVSHVNGINAFEEAVLGDSPAMPFPKESADEVPLLGEIEARLGRLPDYYRVMANDEAYLETIWNRERVTVLEGELDRRTAEYVALAVSITNDADYSTRTRRETLEELGETDEQLFEALQAIEIFQKNNAWTSGLQLDAGPSGE
ncbi:carboxymuconolactone decarboxylase family protein [Halobellus sp. GM3]|uniref:carboxymuconolactone decarboxylase family protein n=1 Tax=Halobellus sp. GM3 TaxID=3458410 RepID=UPI00403D8918